VQGRELDGDAGALVDAAAGREDGGPAPELRDYYLDVSLEDNGDGSKRSPFNDPASPTGVRLAPGATLFVRSRTVVENLEIAGHGTLEEPYLAPVNEVTGRVPTPDHVLPMEQPGSSRTGKILMAALIIVLLLIIIAVVLALLISNGKLGGGTSAMAASIGAGEWIRQLV